jgi:hypothetical protein
MRSGRLVRIGRIVRIDLTWSTQAVVGLSRHNRIGRAWPLQVMIGRIRRKTLRITASSSSKSIGFTR